MRLATSEDLIETQGLGAALERWLRPAGFGRPADVLKDPKLDLARKRAILTSWASDAASVRDEPSLRWLLGTPAPVPLADIQVAMARLDPGTRRRRRTRSRIDPKRPLEDRQRSLT